MDLNLRRIILDLDKLSDLLFVAVCLCSWFPKGRTISAVITDGRILVGSVTWP